jgi:hypothetical protein
MEKKNGIKKIIIIIELKARVCLPSSVL